MLSQAKVGTEQIQDYSNTDKFYTLKLFDYGNYIIFYLRYLQKKIGHNWKQNCVFCACKEYSSVWYSERSSLHQDWKHSFIWVLKLAMAILFNHFILSGAIVCVLGYGKSETWIYIFNTFPTPKVSALQVLVTVYQCSQRCRCIYLHWKLLLTRMISR